MILSFHLACTTAILRPEPSYALGGGGRPLTVVSSIAVWCVGKGIWERDKRAGQ